MRGQFGEEGTPAPSLPPPLSSSLNTKHKTVTDCKLDNNEYSEAERYYCHRTILTVLSKHGSGIPKPARTGEMKQN